MWLRVVFGDSKGAVRCLNAETQHGISKAQLPVRLNCFVHCKGTLWSLLRLNVLLWTDSQFFVITKELPKSFATAIHWLEQNLLSWGHRNVHGSMRPLVFGNHDDADDYDNDGGNNHAGWCQPRSPNKLIFAVKPIGCWGKSSWDMKCGYQTKIIIFL